MSLRVHPEPVQAIMCSILCCYSGNGARLDVSLVLLTNRKSHIQNNLYKNVGAMAKDSYDDISKYFGIPSVEQLITNRHDRFLNRYRCQENYVCQARIM